ncbi:putative membrane protein [Evansella caseinilytica]|uniref:Putative membrane protein n=1 Tax=Evansella caseinilytica TaxID=1503961 RepID=A0A1H3K7K3_9BACI|nr:DUF368 domain-containing protein [Evansella caseinilytica]SDY47578.1 putative membrane protein [Evansella caseinilytica]
MEWRNIYRGAMMGLCDLIPGVSGGTVAVMLGIYDQLIAAINGLFSKKWKKHLLFLLPLGCGMVITILSFSKLIKWLLHHYHGPTMFFFLGLIAGIVPLLVKRARVKERFRGGHYIVLLLAVSLLGLMAYWESVSGKEAEVISSLTGATGIQLFLSGSLASVSMLLPGISGSMVLLLLGVYDTAIDALATFNLPIIIVIGAGVIIGFFVSSKLIRFLLKHYTTYTYAAIIGLVIGSVFVVYPGFAGTAEIFPSVMTFAGGAATSTLLGKRDR